MKLTCEMSGASSFMHPERASEALRTTSEGAIRISIGDKIIDEALGGGFSTNTVTEISGEAGSGKTQFCLKLALHAQLPVEKGGLGSDCKVLYINCLEGEFPAKRLEDLANALETKLASEKVANDVVADGPLRYTAKSFLDNVITRTCPNTDDLVDTLRTDVLEMVDKGNIRLIIIDSIAGVVRPEFNIGGGTVNGQSEGQLRKHFFFAVHQSVQKFARRPGMTMVIVNQIASRIDHWNGPIPGDESHQWANGSVFTMREEGLLPGNGNSIQPALGITWSHLINERLLLVRETDNLRALDVTHAYDLSTHRLPGRDAAEELKSDDNNNTLRATSEVAQAGERKGVSKRTLFMEFSPRTPHMTCAYEITNDGLKGLFAEPLLHLCGK